MKKKILALTLILAICLALLPTAALAYVDGYYDGESSESLDTSVGQSLDQPAPLPDHLAERGNSGSWLLYDFDYSKVLEITRDEWNSRTYTVLEGMEFTVWPNPNWQGTITSMYVSTDDIDSDWICFYYKDYPMRPEDMRYMPPTTIVFEHNVTAPNGDVVDLAKMGETYILHFEACDGAEAIESGAASSFGESFRVIPAIAYASTQTVDIDGKAVEFQMYSIKDANDNDTNYVKVRDVALALDGTAAQFNVGWDGNVNLETGKAYTTRNGQENSTPYSGDQPFVAATSTTNVDGEAADLTAFVITDQSGNGSTYYKLRDLGAALGFTVDWSAERGIFIETK